MSVESSTDTKRPFAMKISGTFWVKIALSICVFAALKILISYVALSSFAIIKIDAEFDHDDVIDVYYSSGIHGTGFRAEQHVRSQPFIGGQRSARKTYLKDNVVRRLRIDTGLQPGTVKLYGIRLISHYGKDITYNHKEIYDNFVPNEGITTYSLNQDHLLIKTISNDPFLTLKSSLIERNFFINYVLPLLLAILAFAIFSRLSFKNFPAFVDIDHKTSSSGINFGALDGARGLAALLVLGQHTGVLGGSGIFGVWLFFCLSGFLLTTPFIRQPDRALSFAYMGNYIIRRIKRIIPMYYTMITITILFLGKFDVAIRHYLFLQANGHYWTVAQEMFFYMLLPLVMIANAIFFKNRKVPAIIFFGLTAYLAQRYITAQLVPLYGNNSTLKPMVGVFMTGVTMAFLYSWLTSAVPQVISHRATKQALSAAGILLLGASIVVSAHLVPGLEHFDASTRSGWFGLAAGLVILLVLLAKDSPFDRLMNLLPLRAVGLVGYSFYLLHPMMISCVRGISTYFTDYYPVSYWLFLLAGISTYLLSTLTYSYIERPFIKAQAPLVDRSADEQPSGQTATISADASSAQLQGEKATPGNGLDHPMKN